jgi:hypothetical protein
MKDRNRNKHRAVLVLIMLGALLGPTVPLRAVDGVVEINQTCAVATGCFSGDTAGFPVTIGTSGSYRLTSDLVVTNGGVIDISGDSVSLDLNGFHIFCDNTFGNCVEVIGSGVGGSGGDDSEVRNGFVSGMGLHGVSLGDRARIRNVRIYNNFGAGVLVRGSSLVTGCIISGNGSQGIKTFDEASLVIDNVITNNGGYGLSGSSSTAYKGNVFQGNNGGAAQVFNADEIDGNLCGFNTTCP